MTSSKTLELEDVNNTFKNDIITCDTACDDGAYKLVFTKRRYNKDGTSSYEDVCMVCVGQYRVAITVAACRTSIDFTAQEGRVFIPSVISQLYEHVKKLCNMQKFVDTYEEGACEKCVREKLEILLTFAS